MKNNKTKKLAIVVGGLVISAVLVALISNEFKTPPVEDVSIPPISSEVGDVVVDDPTDDIKVPPIEIQDKEPETTNGDDEGTEQTIQPDPVKPNPTEEELTDKSQTPSGEKVELPETPEEEQKQKPVETTPPPVDDTPQGGDKEDGKIFVPGFGWIENNGGGGEGTIGESDGDINTQVGIMGN